MSKKISTIKVQHVSVNLLNNEDQEYISLTDIASFKNPKEPKDVVKNWLRNRGTIEFLGLWEKINNPNFKGVEFDSFLFEAGSNSFTLSPTKWIEQTEAIGLISKAGRGGGTYAQRDIAFEFASWVSAEFKLYLIKEYQRLKTDENKKQQLEWNVSRTLAKVNYRIHTDAIKEKLIPVFGNLLEVIVHCLYEMTFISFDQEKIQAELDDLKRTVDEYEKMSPEERKANTTSLDDFLKELDDKDDGEE